MPTPRPWPTWTFDRIETRQAIYHRIKSEPRTGADIATETGLPILEAIDELRILENYKVIRHRADSLGVIYWHHLPGNAWDLEDPPF